MSLQFQVPQFIEVEDKIFGPFTIKQFIYLAGSAGIVFILFSMAPLWLTLLLGIPVMALGAGFAFYKVNNRPLIFIIEASFTYAMNARLYIWKKKQKKIRKDLEEDGADVNPFVPKLSDSKLKDLAWSLDIQENTDKIKNLERTVG